MRINNNFNVVYAENIKPNISYILILFNIFVYFSSIKRLSGYTETLINQFLNQWAFFPETHIFKTYFTSMFLHGDISHLLGNMFFLYIFGIKVEKKIGNLNFFILYIISGCLAVETSLWFYIGTWMEIFPHIGASGAIAGVIGAYLLIGRERSFIGFIFVLFWFLKEFHQIFNYAHHGSFTFVNSWAHFGGMVFGMIIYTIMTLSNKVSEFLKTLNSIIITFIVLYFVAPENIGPYKYRFELIKKCYNFRQILYKDIKAKKKHSLFGKRLVRYKFDIQRLMKNTKFDSGYIEFIKILSINNLSQNEIKNAVQLFSFSVFNFSERLKQITIDDVRIYTLNRELNEIFNTLSISLRMFNPNSFKLFENQFYSWNKKLYELCEEYGVPHNDFNGK